MDKRPLTAQQLRTVKMLHNKRPVKSDLESQDRYEGRAEGTWWGEGGVVCLLV